jgi:hypothetical protein
MEEKRGPYYQYYRLGVDAKIPRSTLHNRRAHLRPFVNESLRRTTNANNVVAETRSVLRNDLNVEELDNTDVLHHDGGAAENFVEAGSDDENEDIVNNDIDGISYDGDVVVNNEDNDDGNIYVNDFVAMDFEQHVEEEDNDRGFDQNCTYDRQIEATVNIKLRDVLLTVYAYALRHNLNWTATENAAQMIAHILGDETIPTSKYHFKKLFCNSIDDKPIIHINCKSCKRYLGTEAELKIDNAPNVCEICNEKINLKTKYNDKNLFTTIPLAPQLKRHIEKSVASGDLVFAENTEIVRDNISDIFDGEFYKSLVKNCHDRKFVTLTVNTDGAPVHKSATKASLWPLQFFINEIRLENRFKRSNILVSSIAFGGTPDMTSFIRPFVEEINFINNNNGLKIDIGGREEHVFVIPLIFTLDSVAKCDVLQKVQYNGYRGCPYCHHKGTLIPSNNIRYCHLHDGSLRTNLNTRNAMLTAHTTGKTARGYKGLSVLCALPYFDLVWQVPIDKMHNMDLGVARKLFDLWLNSSQNRQE